MAKSMPLVVFPVKDLEKAKQLYGIYLGVEPYADSEYYVGYRLDNLEVGLDPNATTIISYTDVDDIEASLKALTDAGAEVVKESTDVGGGLLIAQIELDGNTMGFRQQSK